MDTTPYSGRLVSLTFTDLGMGNKCYANLAITPNSSPVSMVDIEVYELVHNNMVMKQPLQLSRNGQNPGVETYLGAVSLQPQRYYFKVTWVDPVLGTMSDVPLAGPGP